MSLKEKMQIVLNQRGEFKCPNYAGSSKPAVQPKTTTAPEEKDDPIAPKKAPAKTPAAATTKEDRIKLVVANLKQRGNSKPRTLKTLTSTVSSLFPKKLSPNELASLMQQLQSSGKVIVKDGKASYAL